MGEGVNGGVISDQWKSGTPETFNYVELSDEQIEVWREACQSAYTDCYAKYPVTEEWVKLVEQWDTELD